MYAIRVRNVNFCHVYKQAMHQPWSTVDVTPDSQFVKEYAGHVNLAGEIALTVHAKLQIWQPC